VPVTIDEIHIYKNKIQKIMKPYLVQDSKEKYGRQHTDNKKENIKIIRRVADKYEIFWGSLYKFIFEEELSYTIKAKLVKKLKDAGL
jgi:predicted ABC-type ATPase